MITVALPFPVPKCEPGEPTWLFQEASIPEISNRISEYLDTFPLFGHEGLALSDEDLFFYGPVGVIGIVVIRLRMGHEAEDPATGITYTGDVFKGPIWVEGPLTTRRSSILSGILQNHLMIRDELPDVMIRGIYLSFPMSYGEFQGRKSLGKNTWRILIYLEIHPRINKIARVVIGDGRAPLSVSLFKTGKEPQVDQGLKAIAYADDQFTIPDKTIYLFTKMVFHL